MENDKQLLDCNIGTNLFCSKGIFIVSQIVF